MHEQPVYENKQQLFEAMVKLAPHQTGYMGDTKKFVLHHRITLNDWTIIELGARYTFADRFDLHPDLAQELKAGWTCSTWCNYHRMTLRNILKRWGGKEWVAKFDQAIADDKAAKEKAQRQAPLFHARNALKEAYEKLLDAGSSVDDEIAQVEKMIENLEKKIVKA